MRYILVCIVLASVTFGQLIIKHGTNGLGPVPFGDTKGVLLYGLHALTNAYILSGLAAAFLAALAWMAALSKYELSSVYPLLSLNFIIVPLASVALYGEQFNLYKGLGCITIVIGVFVFARGI